MGATTDRDVVPMATVGVLGGMSSASTREYYRLLDERINDELGGHDAAEVLIRSVNFGNVERFISEKRWDAAASYLVENALALQRGGAGFVLLATNTMHKVAPEVSAALEIPLVHIVDVTADAAYDRGVETVGVLGTAATMELPFYRERFGSNGLDVVVPDADDRALVDEVIFEELVRDVVREDSRREYVRIMDDLVAAGAEAIVLGCTEIELLVTPDDFDAVPLLDTTALHVERAVELALAETPD